MNLAVIPSDDISYFLSQENAAIELIVAGMTAIIDVNSEKFSAMKDQKWFQRMWLTISGKNNATVKEMERNRDKLTEYSVQVISKIIEEKRISDVFISNLAIRLNEIYFSHLQLQNVMVKLVDKLSKKIESIDNFQNLITDIQNDKFALSKERNNLFKRNEYIPKELIINLFKIFLRLDNRVISDKDLFNRIKETLEKHGYDFSQDVSVKSFVVQIIALPEENIGQIYMFAQNHTQFIFIQLVCCLIEQYHFAPKSNRQIIKEKAIESALRSCGLKIDSPSCNIGEFYEDIYQSAGNKIGMLKQVPIALPTEDNKDNEGEKATGDETVTKNLRRTIITFKYIGKVPESDEGKVLLISALKSIKEKSNSLSEDAKTYYAHFYSILGVAPLPQFDPEKLENLGKENSRPILKVLLEYKAFFSDKATLSFVEDIVSHINLSPKIRKEFEQSVEETVRDVGLVGILNKYKNDAVDEDLLSEIKKITDEKQSRLEEIEKTAKKVVIAASAAAVGIASVPIPFADAPLLIVNQVALLSSIAVIFKIDIKKDGLKTLVFAALGVGGATFIGRTLVTNLLKFIPGIGIVAGGAIAASTAAIITYAMGHAFVEICKDVKLGKLRMEDVTSKEGTNVFKEYFNSFTKKKAKEKKLESIDEKEDI